MANERILVPARRQASPSDGVLSLIPTPPAHRSLSPRPIVASSSSTTLRAKASSPTSPRKPRDLDGSRSFHNHQNPLQSSFRSFNLRTISVLCLIIIAYYWILPAFHARRDGSQHQSVGLQILKPSPHPDSKSRTDPEAWLREHADNLLRNHSAVEHPSRLSKRPRAALISLVRNEELEGMLQSMRQLELHWNRRYNYPWVFFNELPFSEEFKAATKNATSAPVFYHQIPRQHWSTPPFVDWDRYEDSLDYLGAISVGKGHMLSYRHMCRWNSGFFYLHPALSDYEFYWRVEPDVHFFCDVSYDVFRFMRDNELVYGFNMNILDDARSFPSLWSRTREFVDRFPHLVHPKADVAWLMDEDQAGEYNNCQFFSNFEIGSLDFFRGEANTAFFKHLDTSGGFFYERYGDAPIHTLSVSLFAPKDKVWFFRDIGYQHDIARQCPADGVRSGRCDCEPTGLDENFYKLVPMESPQRKPADSCIRLWIGGEWLEKKDGWDQEVERLMGGDGYGGYVRDTL